MIFLGLINSDESNAMPPCQKKESIESLEILKLKKEIEKKNFLLKKKTNELKKRDRLINKLQGAKKGNFKNPSKKKIQDFLIDVDKIFQSNPELATFIKTQANQQNVSRVGDTPRNLLNLL